MSIVHEVYESHEVYGFTGKPPMILTCEHASKRIPSPLRTTPSDRKWLSTHWGWDIGARTVCREVIRQTESLGLFARFSRLLADANRHPEHEHLVRCAVEGEVLSFNQNLTIEEVDRRLEKYHAPFHAAVDRAMAHRMKQDADVLLLAVHSFTPQLGDEKRTMEMGVLFDRHDPIAHRFRDELTAEGFVTALNEPYSGREGLMYSAHRHGIANDALFLELEINQAIIGTAADARAVGRALTRALDRLRFRGDRKTA